MNINFFKKSKYKVFFSLIIIFSVFLPQNILIAETMGSSTYKIQSDTINMGGVDSSSASYNMQGTLGEVATGKTSSSNYKMNAGYWQMQESYLAISDISNTTLSSMGGLSNQASEGTMSWLVKTDNPAGYTFSIASATTPSLKSAFDSFPDYTPSGSNPDFNFNVPSDKSSFGFSMEGTDAASRFKDNGSVCGTGSLETTDKCWEGLSTTPKEVAGSSSPNHPLGSTVTARLRAENGSDHIQTAGDYTVTIVVTAVTL